MHVQLETLQNAWLCFISYVVIDFLACFSCFYCIFIIHYRVSIRVFIWRAFDESMDRSNSLEILTVVVIKEM